MNPQYQDELATSINNLPKWYENQSNIIDDKGQYLTKCVRLFFKGKN